jgi:hypothetical protein
MRTLMLQPRLVDVTDHRMVGYGLDSSKEGPAYLARRLHTAKWVQEHRIVTGLGPMTHMSFFGEAVISHCSHDFDNLAGSTATLIHHLDVTTKSS